MTAVPHPFDVCKILFLLPCCYPGLSLQLSLEQVEWLHRELISQLWNSVLGPVAEMLGHQERGSCVVFGAHRGLIFPFRVGTVGILVRARLQEIPVTAEDICVWQELVMGFWKKSFSDLMLVTASKPKHPERLHS